MSDTKTRLKRMQLMDAQRAYPSPEAAAMPRAGWVRAIREALGMSQAQLAGRMGISRQSLQDMEKSEAERRIMLDSLDRAARAMGCRVVYSLVPESGSLDDLLERRANQVADALLRPADHSMKLEAQGVGEMERQRRLLVDELLRGNPGKLWR